MADQELMKHLCKVCGKMFSNGRSLGGHMRSHLSSLSSYQDVVDADEEEEERAGYGLRENPRKTWRLSDQCVCEVCGIGFPSQRSLYGHLTCHQEENEEVGLESQSNSEVSDVVAIKKRKRRRRRVRRVATITSDSVSVSESEKEDGALSLMMLSRDYSSIKQHSIGSELGVKSNLKRKRVSQFDPNCVAQPEKAKRYKCVTCNKVFNSYQALGGHRTSHRKTEAYVSSLAPNSPVGSYSMDETVYRSSLPRRRNDHECPICHKVFSSGQALGGHKRSHLVSVTETVSIDLNLPAPDNGD